MQIAEWDQDVKARDSKILNDWEQKISNGYKINYEKVLTLFGKTKDSFSDKSMLDVGCGPFGGVLSVIENAKRKIGIDILADSYNERNMMNISQDIEIVQGDIQYAVPIFGKNKFDVIFCVNMLDHCDGYGSVSKALKSMYELLKNKGEFLFHVHCRTPEQLNKLHLYAYEDFEWRNIILKAGFEPIEWAIEKIDPLHIGLTNRTYKTIIARFTKNGTIQK